jgi:hypothetical protein
MLSSFIVPLLSTNFRSENVDTSLAVIHFYFLILKEQLEYANIICPLFCDPIQVLCTSSAFLIYIYIYSYIHLACSSFKTNVP